jgi:hypothetical protein
MREQTTRPRQRSAAHCAQGRCTLAPRFTHVQPMGVERGFRWVPHQVQPPRAASAQGGGGVVGVHGATRRVLQAVGLGARFVKPRSVVTGDVRDTVDHLLERIGGAWLQLTSKINLNRCRHTAIRGHKGAPSEPRGQVARPEVRRQGPCTWMSSGPTMPSTALQRSMFRGARSRNTPILVNRISRTSL